MIDRDARPVVDDIEVASDLLETAWGIIANVGGGDWERESELWRSAAVSWRDRYFKKIRIEKK